MTDPRDGGRNGGVHPVLTLDERRSARLRSRRLERLNTDTVPRLRLLGLNLLVLGVVLHNRFFLGGVDLGVILPYAVAMEAYCVLSWLVLRRWYEPHRKPDLGMIFLVLDLLPLALTVYVSGAERSWIFWVFLFRVTDQTQTTFRRVLLFAHLAALSYLLVVAYADLVDGRTVAWTPELVKTLFLYLGALYIATTARPAERIRNRLAQVVRVAREAVRGLEEKSAELERSREQAEAGSRAKSEFLSRVSHELRTPMNAIMGFAQLLEMESLTAEQQAHVDEIMDGGRHLLDIINEVMDISRVETGALAQELEPVDLAAAIADVLDRSRPAAEAAGVTLPDAPPADCGGWVMATPRKLRQVVANLISNAIKYNSRPGTVTLGCERSEGRIRVSVTDTGRGIPSDRIEEAFTPFQRLGAERTDVGGTGLGLAVARSLTEAMGGALGVETAVDAGSTFWFELEATDPPGRPGTAEPGGLAGDAADVAAPSGRRVLYIDDKPDNIALVRRILARRPGVELLAASQGLEGLEMARRERPDLILLDLQLPDISGREVLGRLRDDASTLDIPVVVVSAEASPARIERLLGEGAHAYFAMPYDVARFLDVIDDLLGQDRS